MGLLDPLNLLFGLSLAALVAIYLRARSRPTIEVSSIALFETAPAPVARSRVLRVDALFWLEAAALAALTLVAAGFYVRETAPVSPIVRHALIFDLGAAMDAYDGGVTRLGTAQQAALALVDEAPTNHEFSVIGYALEARRIRAATVRKAELRRTINGLTAAAAAPRPAALRAALIDATDSPQIELFTDHQPAPEILADARARATVVVHLVGAPADNLALVTLDPGVPKSSEGRAVVRNFSPRPQSCEVEIDANGREVFHSILIVEPRMQATVRFGPLAQGGIVRARILTADGLSADDQRYALAPSVAPARALVVSPDSTARDDLARIVLAVDPAYRVTASDVSAAALSELAQQKFDLAVLHDFSGAGIIAAARLFVFPEPGFTGSPEPALTGSRAPSPLKVVSTVAQAELRSRADAPPLAIPVMLGPARVIALPGWMDPLALGAEAEDQPAFPLAGVGRAADGWIGVLGFDVRNHLLLDPDRLEALLLTIDTLKRLAAPADLEVVSTGEFVSLATFAPATLISPAGARSQLIPDRWGRVRFRPFGAGRYAVLANRRVTEVFANYYDAAESDLAAPPTASTPPERPAAAVAIHTERQVVSQTAPLIGVVLILLLLESALLARRTARWRMSHV